MSAFEGAAVATEVLGTSLSDPREKGRL